MCNFKKITTNSGLISFGNTGARLSDPRATYIKILDALVEFRKLKLGHSITSRIWEIIRRA